MARYRVVKPAFFKDEDLSELSIGARLLFVGMWCLADRKGRLEDRPKFIRSELFPYETMDLEPWIAELAPKFISRYIVDGRKYIQVNNFEKHQKPHQNEPESVIPAKTSDNGGSPSDNGGSKPDNDHQSTTRSGSGSREVEKRSVGSGESGRSASADAGLPPPENPPSNLATMPKSWALDESYAPMVEAWRQVTPEVTESEIQRCHRSYWTSMDPDQRQLAISRLLEAVTAGRQVSSRLDYWLKEDYKRQPRDPPKDKQQARRDQTVLAARLINSIGDPR